MTEGGIYLKEKNIQYNKKDLGRFKKIANDVKNRLTDKEKREMVEVLAGYYILSNIKKIIEENKLELRIFLEDEKNKNIEIIKNNYKLANEILTEIEDSEELMFYITKMNKKRIYKKIEKIINDLKDQYEKIITEIIFHAMEIVVIVRFLNEGRLNI